MKNSTRKHLIFTVASMLLVLAFAVPSLAADFNLWVFQPNSPDSGSAIPKNDNEKNFYVTVVDYVIPSPDTVYFGSRRGNNPSLVTSDGLAWNVSRAKAQKCAYFSSAGAAKGVSFFLQMKANSMSNVVPKGINVSGRWNP